MRPRWTLGLPWWAWTLLTFAGFYVTGWTAIDRDSATIAAAGFCLTVAAGWLTVSTIARRLWIGLPGALSAAAVCATLWLARSPESEMQEMGWMLALGSLGLFLAMMIAGVTAGLDRAPLGHLGAELTAEPDSDPADD